MPEVFKSPWGEIPLFGGEVDEEESALVHALATVTLKAGSSVLLLGGGRGALCACLGLRRSRVVLVSDSAREQTLCLRTWLELGLEEKDLLLADPLNVPRQEYAAGFLPRPRDPTQWEYWLEEARRQLPRGAAVLGCPPRPEGYREWRKWIGGEVREDWVVLKGSNPEEYRLAWAQRHVEFPPLKVRAVVHPSLPLTMPDAAETLLLRTFPRPAPRDRILIVGQVGLFVTAACAKTHPDSRIWFVSDSFTLVWSARQTFVAMDLRGANFLVSSGFEDFDRETFDLILWLHDPVQPGFTLDSALALLRPGGELRLVHREEDLALFSQPPVPCSSRVAGRADGYVVSCLVRV